MSVATLIPTKTMRIKRDMLNRRGFFGLMGSAAVAGPNTVKQASALTLTDLRVEGLISTAAGALEEIDASPDHEGIVKYATKEIAKRALRSKEQLKAEKQDMYVSGLDPNVATLRSVALHRKIAMTREISWKHKEARKDNYLNGLLKGWFR